jgi:hypothetical protein
VTYPKVVGRAPQSEDTNAAVNVRMSDAPNDVIHMALKRDETLSDEEAIVCAEYLREVQKLEARHRPPAGH